jgi:hypothetical protein
MACLLGLARGIRATPEAATTVGAKITVATAGTTIATKAEVIAAAMEVVTKVAMPEATIDMEAEATAAVTQVVMASVPMADSTPPITVFVGDITEVVLTVARDSAATATTVVDLTAATDFGVVATTAVALTAAVVIMAMAGITGTAGITIAGNGFSWAAAGEGARPTLAKSTILTNKVKGGRVISSTRAILLPGWAV